MQPNKTRAKLEAGETAFGCFVRYPDAGLIELLGYLGWDFLVFDGEHGPLEPRDCEHMVRAAELSGATPIVRVATNQAHVILRFMDTGAQGAQVPTVDSAAEARAVVQSVKYHPRGVRGLAGVRASGYGQKGPLTEYMQQAKQARVQFNTLPAYQAYGYDARTGTVDILENPLDKKNQYEAAGIPLGE